MYNENRGLEILVFRLPNETQYARGSQGLRIYVGVIWFVFHVSNFYQLDIHNGSHVSKYAMYIYIILQRACACLLTSPLDT